jgi:membrane protease YdiL (CAAX protease family)
MASTGMNQRLLSVSGTRRWFIIASPVIIVILGSVVARASLALFGQWAWLPTALIYWGSMAAVIALFSGREKALNWFGPSRGSLIWPVLAVLIGLAPFPMLLLPHTSLLRAPLLAVLWILFGLINGPMEEAYWRGFLFNEIRGWPKWLVVCYASVLFVAIHFLMLGAFSSAFFNVPFLVILIVITLVYALIYLRTGSLRWPVLSHILADWGNMNIFVFMGLIHL